MKRFITYPSIDQFGQVVRNIQKTTQYVGQDDDGNIIVNRNAKMPKIGVTATEKIHGTNAAVCYSIPDGFWVQSRKNIISIEKDNAGCAAYAENIGSAWREIIFDLAVKHNIDLNTHIISVYFEWAGGSIQKNSALTGSEKKAIIFRHFKVSPVDADTDERAVWFETVGQNGPVDNPDAGIYNILNFPTWSFEIDFDNPLMSQNEMIKLVEEIIEPASPVGKQFGFESNIGEGIVVSFHYKDSMYQFKVKGEKHSKSKVKTLKKVDEAELQKIQDVAQQVTPAWRLEQMFDEANDRINGGYPDIKNMGKFMKLLNTDILKEEMQVFIDNGLDPKQVFGTISKIARVWYNDQLNADL